MLLEETNCQATYALHYPGGLVLVNELVCLVLLLYLAVYCTCVSMPPSGNCITVCDAIEINIIRLLAN